MLCPVFSSELCLEGHFHSSNSESEEGNWDFTGCLSHPVVGAVGSQQESYVVLIGNSKLQTLEDENVNGRFCLSVLALR